MNHDVIITCALTGAGDTTSRSPHVPVTPKQIAAAAVEAAKAGATVVHCHVRDPETGKFSRDVALYREVMERIREADIDIIVNLTARQWADQVGVGAELHRVFAGADLQVAAHARREVDDDVDVGLADALHHFAV